MSTTRLYILSSRRSQVFVPSPHGDFLVVILKVFLGIRTGPLTLNPFILALCTSSWHTIQLSFPNNVFLKDYQPPSTAFKFLLVKVMRILFGDSVDSNPTFLVGGAATVAISTKTLC